MLCLCVWWLVCCLFFRLAVVFIGALLLACYWCFFLVLSCFLSSIINFIYVVYKNKMVQFIETEILD